MSTGGTNSLVEIPVGNRTAYVDTIDAPVVRQFKWHLVDNDTQCYASAWDYRCSPRRRLSMHHLLFPARSGYEVDHINGNGLDNRRSNLRYCTKAENQKNRAPNRNGKSSYKGVGWYPSKGKWRARIRIDNRQKFLGYFDSELLAAIVYDIEAMLDDPVHSRINFPDIVSHKP